MIVVRPIQQADLSQYQALAQAASPGLTNLPNDFTALKRNIDHAAASIAKNEGFPQDEVYIFVLEDTKTGKIVGTSSVKAKTGIQKPLYYFQRKTITADCMYLPVEEEMEVLLLVSYTNAPSELCGLFILPEARKEGLGKLISLSRLLFIAAFPNRFDEMIFAEMRGNATEDGTAFFWEAIGRRFLNITYPELMKLYEEDFDFIPHLLPKFPIYVRLLSENAQKVIGQPHQKTAPAFKMLLKEGLLPSGEIDVFDGGPRLVGKTIDMHSVKTSQTIQIKKIEAVDAEPCLIANGKMDFRCCYGRLESETIDPATAEVLKVKVGDVVRYIKRDTP